MPCEPIETGKEGSRIDVHAVKVLQSLEEKARRAFDFELEQVRLWVATRHHRSEIVVERLGWIAGCEEDALLDGEALVQPKRVN